MPFNATVVLMGLGIVFIGLICLIVIISIMNSFFKTTKNKEDTPAVPANTPAQSPCAEQQLSGEAVAAVSAAIAETLGKDVSGIRILSIKKVN